MQYSTRGLFYYERLGHHLETSAQYPHDHEKKRYRKKDHKFTWKKMNTLIHVPT